MTVEAAVATTNLGADTGRYSAIDALWVTSEARGDGTGRGRSPTIQNPSAVAEAAAADAAVAAAHAQAAAHAAARASQAAMPQPVAQPAPVPAPEPVAPTGTGVGSPVCAFRVAVFPADRPGGTPRVVALSPGAAAPAGATAGMLVATTEGESACLARIFGYTG